MPTVFTRRQERAADRHATHLLDQIASAYKTGDLRSVIYLTRVYLASYQVGLAAVCEARCKLPILQRPALQQIPVIAGKLNAWAGTDEPVKVNLVKKDQEGNTRIVLDFGIENRSLQHMILALVKARGDLHPLQFGTKGVPHAIDKVVELMKDGYLWTIETDLANCFPSFEGENLHKFLHIPKRVIRHVIMAEHLNLIPGDRLKYLFGAAGDFEGDPEGIALHLAEARRGFPHGSAPASYIAEVLLAPVLKSLPFASRVPSYADNLLTMAPSKEEAESMTESLWSALKAQPVGQLKPKLISRSKPGDPINFLGHRVNLKNGEVLITPTPENDMEFERQVHRRCKCLEKPAKPAVRQARAEELREYVVSWAAAFSRCAGVQSRRDYWLFKIESKFG